MTIAKMGYGKISLLAGALLATLLLGLTACGGADPEPEPAAPDTAAITAAVQAAMGGMES